MVPVMPATSPAFPAVTSQATAAAEQEDGGLQGRAPQGRGGSGHAAQEKAPRGRCALSELQPKALC